MAYNPLNPNGQASMIASQPVVIASDQSPVSVLATISGRPSISGQVGASVVGTVPVTQTTNPWVITGSVQGSFAPSGNQSVSGTVGASVIGTIPVTMAGAWTTSVVGTVFIGGSVATVGTAAANQSVSGSVGIVGNPSISGTVITNQGTNPWIIIGSVQGSFSPSGNQSVSGTVGASIIGTAPVTQAGTWIASVFGNVSVLGTVPVTESGTWNVSVVGSYGEDVAHTSGDVGLFTMGVRNDTMASVTSADLDYSPHMVGPSGETVVANSPLTKWVQGTASMLGGLPVTGSLVPIIAAQGASIFTYITGLQIANASGNNAWITLLGGTNSVIGYTVAPANGGSNIVLPNALKTNANAAFSASISAVASVYLSAQGFISKS
jgi:hypothetical protein